MSNSGVTVTPDCVQKFNELKLGKTIKYIIYKLSDDYKEIVVEDSSTDADWDSFRDKLKNAKAAYKGKEGAGPRYAVYDFEYDLGAGEGTRYVGTSLKRGRLGYGSEESRSADAAPRMTYASSKDALKKALNGIGAEVQANNEEEIEYSAILKDVSKGKR
ncbi:MAG: hypothetical protein Q9201_005674 [Fulgogasparrea decipioides]